MSYCRFGWDGSDVYVFESTSGGIECCGCQLEGGGYSTSWREELTRADYADMVAHLQRHRRAGHKVPQTALDELSVEGKLRNRYTLTLKLRYWLWRLKRQWCRRRGHKPVPTFPHMADHELGVSSWRTCARCGDHNPCPDSGGKWMQDEAELYALRARP